MRITSMTTAPAATTTAAATTAVTSSCRRLTSPAVLYIGTPLTELNNYFKSTRSIASSPAVLYIGTPLTELKLNQPDRNSKYFGRQAAEAGMAVKAKATRALPHQIPWIPRFSFRGFGLIMVCLCCRAADA